MGTIGFYFVFKDEQDDSQILLYIQFFLRHFSFTYKNQINYVAFNDLLNSADFKNALEYLDGDRFNSSNGCFFKTSSINLATLKKKV